MKRLGLLLAGGITACVTIAPPVVRDIPAHRPLRDVHQCVTEQLVDAGYLITETRRDDGVIEGEQAAKISYLRGGSEFKADGFNAVDVLIFERADGSTSIQYKAISMTRDRELTSPTEEVKVTADRIATACAA